MKYNECNHSPLNARKLFSSPTITSGITFRKMELEEMRNMEEENENLVGEPRNNMLVRLTRRSEDSLETDFGRLGSGGR